MKLAKSGSHCKTNAWKSSSPLDSYGELDCGAMSNAKQFILFDGFCSNILTPRTPGVISDDAFAKELLGLGLELVGTILQDEFALHDRI